MTIAILVLVHSCSIFHKPYVYDFCITEKGTESKIIKNDIVGFADTTLAFLSVQAFDPNKDSIFIITSAYLENIDTKETYQQGNIREGELKFTIAPGQYKLKIKAVSLSEILINIKLKSGEIRKIDAELGYPISYTSVRIESKKKLTKKELFEIIEKRNKSNESN